MAQLVPILISFVVSTALTIALAWIVGPNNQANYGEKLRLPDIQTSNYGIALSRLIGQSRLAGNVIWQAKIREVAVTTSQSISGGILKPSSTISNTTFIYFADFAVGIVGHQIVGITRLWADDVLLYDSANLTGPTLAALGATLYFGTEIQGVSALIEAIDGVGTHPAYRGLAYMTFSNFPLQQYGNRIPRMSFEIEGA
jgi:hypothetical protein